MKKLFLYPLMLCIAFCFYGCEDNYSCIECEGLCCYKEFSPPMALNDEIELDLDANGKNDVRIKNLNGAVEVKAISDRVQITFGKSELSLPSSSRRYISIRKNSRLNFDWEWSKSMTTSQNNRIDIGEYIGVRFEGKDAYYFGWIEVSFNFPSYTDFKVHSMYLYKGVNNFVYAGVRNPDCN